MKNQLAPPIMESILNKRFNTYNLRNFQYFAMKRKRTVWYGLETFSYHNPQLWYILPESLKEMMNSVSQFKRNINIGYVVTVPAGCVKFIFKTLGFYNLKSHLFVKLAHLATTTHKCLFYLYIFFIIDLWLV